MCAKKQKLLFCALVVLLIGFYSFADDQPTPEIESATEESSSPKTERRVAAQLEGSFIGKNGTTGVILFDLFDDGTMVGKWESDNRSTALEAHGFYVIKNWVMNFSVFGETLLLSTTKARVLVNASGKLEGYNLKGTFKGFVEHTKFKDDEGEWQGKITMR